MSILYVSNIVKNWTDNQINQIKNLIKLILRLFYHVMPLSYNFDKKNMNAKKTVI